MPGLNTGGQPVTLVAKINDGTGATVTVAAAATPQAILDATLFLEDTNTSGGGLTFDGATGVVTVATPAGIGKYEVFAFAGDLIGTNSAVLDVEIVASEAGASAAQVGIGSRKTELATAARNGIAPAYAVVDLSAVDDTVQANLRVGTNGHEGTFRDFALVMRKIGEAI
jgi:hypothetical protein